MTGSAHYSGRKNKRQVDAASGSGALQFPANVEGANTAAPYAVIEFERPDLDGLPKTGPGNAGWTVVRKIKVDDQEGYYAQFWYTQGDGEGPINGEFYAGFHPYPTSGNNQGTSHEWELATEGGDFRTTVGGGTLSVNKGSTYIQALRVEHNSGAPIMTFYPALPSVANGNKIVRSCNAGYASASCPSPLLTCGDSPWFATFQHERFGGVLDAQHIYARALSDGEIQTVGANFAAALSGIWWGKNGFDSIDDLTCDFGTGRSFVRNDDSDLITLVSRL